MTDLQLLDHTTLPESFASVVELDDFMSLPTEATVRDLAAVEGDVIILGVAGKMGMGLARLIKRAAPHKRVIGVARFSDEGSEEWLNGYGVETIKCDLLDREAVARLPKLPNVIYMAGLKFDYRGREDFLWAMNTIAPAIVAEEFKASRIVSLSTIHVYPWSDPRRGGVTEDEPPMARPGEYANSVVGRERTFQYYSRLHGTPGRIVRFVYAIDMRYGVLQEIASWVKDGIPIPLGTGNVNIQWQGDAINHFARLLNHVDVPASPINIGGPENVSVRRVAREFGEIFGVEPVFQGEESDHALFVNCDRAAELLGNPTVPVNAMVRWVADWVDNDKPLYGKPSKFQVRTGIF
jgi:nucleoside-diphosphate-sugar epimerase